jgi:hypothetical protein
MSARSSRSFRRALLALCICKIILLASYFWLHRYFVFLKLRK